MLDATDSLGLPVPNNQTLLPGHIGNHANLVHLKQLPHKGEVIFISACIAQMRTGNVNESCFQPLQSALAGTGNDKYFKAQTIDLGGENGCGGIAAAQENALSRIQLVERVDVDTKLSCQRAIRFRQRRKCNSSHQRLELQQRQLPIRQSWSGWPFLGCVSEERNLTLICDGALGASASSKNISSTRQSSTRASWRATVVFGSITSRFDGIDRRAADPNVASQLRCRDSTLFPNCLNTVLYAHLYSFKTASVREHSSMRNSGRPMLPCSPHIFASTYAYTTTSSLHDMHTYLRKPSEARVPPSVAAVS